MSRGKYLSLEEARRLGKMDQRVALRCGILSSFPYESQLKPFQRRFLRGALRPEISTAALSLPRGNGKSWLASHVVARILDPSDELFRRGTESVLCAANIEQARIVFRFAREVLEPTGEYRFLDSVSRIGITHRGTNTRLRVISSSGKSAMGLVGCPWAIGDEPGSWEVNGGLLMWDALTTARGKPGSPLKILLIGTLAPSTGGWWSNLIEDGTGGSTFVQALRGNPEKWDSWPEIRRCNPLVSAFKDSRKVLMEERAEARRDSRLKARFLSYRLNCPCPDEASMLLTVADFNVACARDVPPPDGKPIIGIDLGAGRAWSAAVALWASGRCEAIAVAGGVPSIGAQEKRDRVPRGSYQRLVDAGLLRIAEGLRVPPVPLLLDAAREAWGAPDHIICDRFRISELLDHARGILVAPRITRWSEASEDVRALRRLFLDGPIVPAVASRPLLIASLAVAMVRNDDQGSTRLVKRDANNNTGRDDVAAALTLAAGSLGRFLAKPRGRGVYLGLVS